MSLESFKQEFASDMPENEQLLIAAEYLGVATTMFFSACREYKQKPDVSYKKLLMHETEEYIKALGKYFKAISDDPDMDSYNGAMECQTVTFGLHRERIAFFNTLFEEEMLVTVEEPAIIPREKWNKKQKPEEEVKKWACIQQVDIAAENIREDTGDFIMLVETSEQ